MFFDIYVIAENIVTGYGDNKSYLIVVCRISKGKVDILCNLYGKRNP